VLEVALIAAQVSRGETSHFNSSSVANIVVFAVMGAAILIQTLAAMVLTAALWRHAFADRALGLSIRLGMTIAIAGAFTGGLMTQPTPDQLANARLTGDMPRSGAHTVGAPDGGPGLPGTGWSLEHGDIRVPHFVGLHAMQVLPAAVLILGRRRRDITRVRIATMASVLHAMLFGTLLAQALAGQSLVHPAGVVAWALAGWLFALAVFFVWLWRDARQTAFANGWRLA
jgi:hypothetical protein